MKSHQTRNFNKKKFPGPFRETYPETYAPTYSETYVESYGQVSLEETPPDIFDPENLYRTIWHIHTRAENPAYGLSGDDMEIVDSMLDDIEFLVGIQPDQNEYSSSQGDDSLTVTKAIDPLSSDIKLSYNKVSLQINGLKIEWYFKLKEAESDVEEKGSNLKNVQKNPEKAEIIYEKSDANKGEFNNTGYSFSWSDGRKMNNRDVTIFIRQKKKEGDQNFIKDFPVVKKVSEQAPTYTIPGSEYTYYSYDSRFDDPMKDGHNLKSDLFKGVIELELSYDDKLPIGKGSPSGDYIVRIKKSLNSVYKDDNTFTALAEDESFDQATANAIKRFQKDYSLGKGGNGVIGVETIGKLDELIAKTEASDKANQKKAAQLKAQDDAKENTFKEKLEKLKKSPKTGLNFEVNTGVNASLVSIDGVLTGFYTLRSSSSASSLKMGLLKGDQVPVKVIDKIGEGEKAWYKIAFNSPLTYSDLTKDELDNIKKDTSAKALYDSNTAWVTSDAAYLIMPYDSFMEEIRKFEAIYNDLTLQDRVTKLRQMAHTDKFDFDQVIGTPKGNYYLNQRHTFDHIYQLLKDAQGLRLPNGEVVDIYHFIVGLDALVPARRVEKRSYSDYVTIADIGSSYAASTWSGDIGAAAEDVFIGQDKEYEKQFTADKSDLNTRRDHYYNSRAPETDLLGDIDTWGATAMITDQKTTSIEDVLKKYYGQTADETNKLLSTNRQQSIKLFLQNYGFTSAENLTSQPTPFIKIIDQIYKFAQVWASNRETFTPYSSDAWTVIYDNSMYMAIKFLKWLEGLAKQYGVKL
ncbi:hypothetical protein BH11BAC7_BH11BAC7_11430 [soil metagenome]